MLRCGGGGGAIGLRADLDALHIAERSGVAYASRHEGRMHACGHDGHTAMLLGAAKALARRRRFDGTVYFIFQPAEENEGGGRVMVEEGLFDKFPMRAVYGMHNWPRKPLGSFAMRPGPLMGAYDIFEIVATGKGAHAAMAYMGKDPMLFAAHAINALQTIVARNLHPLDAGVVSVTQVHGGDTWNVIPQEVVLRGTVRTFEPAVQDLIEQRMRTIVAGVAATFEMSATVRYERRYPATVNAENETRHALAAATAVVGADHVETDPTPEMGSEDFAFMLQAKPGCYVWLGAGQRARHAQHPQPALRFQRRRAGDRRELLGDAGRAAVGCRGGAEGGLAACSLSRSERGERMPRDHRFLVGRDHPCRNAAAFAADPRPAGRVGCSSSIDAQPRRVADRSARGSAPRARRCRR